MKIEVEKPNIVRIAYHQEPGDPNYGSCLWAYFDFDLDEHLLSIQSDCGNFAYGYWDVGSAGFLRFLCCIHEDYLLGKLAKESEFDLEATVDGVKETLEDIGEYSKKKINSLIQDLRDQLKYCHDEGKSEYRVLEDWNDEHDLDLCDLCEAAVYDYPVYAKRIVRIFINCIQPKIRELVQEETA